MLLAKEAPAIRSCYRADLFKIITVCLASHDSSLLGIIELDYKEAKNECRSVAKRFML
jgi:hypothetical protein